MAASGVATFRLATEQFVFSSSLSASMTSREAFSRSSCRRVSSSVCSSVFWRVERSRLSVWLKSRLTAVTVNGPLALTCMLLSSR